MFGLEAIRTHPVIYIIFPNLTRLEVMTMEVHPQVY